MIEESTAPVYSASCNVCKSEFEDPFEGWSVFMNQDHMRDRMADDGWHIDEDNCYCPKCHEMDDEDNLIVLPVPNP